MLGMEFRNYETDNDFLIVGLTEDFLYRHPNLYELPLAKAIDVFHENGMLVIQAHPVRCRIVGIEAGKLYTEDREVNRCCIFWKLIQKWKKCPIMKE